MASSQTLVPRPARANARAAPCMRVVDLFPDPPSVGGNVVVPPPSTFPATLEIGPASASTLRPATITPFADWGASFFAELQPQDGVAAVFLGVALLLGPDFLLAPAGLVSDRGIRPGFALEGALGRMLQPDAQWVKDRDEDLAASAPLAVRLPVLLLCIAGGLLLDRLLVVALEDTTFVISVGICACIGGGLLEVIREPRPTREERDLKLQLEAEFLAFSASRLEVGGRCHETEIVRAFRKFYPRYRSRDMGRTADGVSLSDDRISDALSVWNRQMGRPGERTSSGYWKGISLAAEAPRSPP